MHSSGGVALLCDEGRMMPSEYLAVPESSGSDVPLLADAVSAATWLLIVAIVQNVGKLHENYWHEDSLQEFCRRGCEAIMQTEHTLVQCDQRECWLIGGRLTGTPDSSTRAWVRQGA